jgi:hypothetical protein
MLRCPGPEPDTPEPVFPLFSVPVLNPCGMQRTPNSHNRVIRSRSHSLWLSGNEPLEKAVELMQIRYRYVTYGVHAKSDVDLVFRDNHFCSCDWSYVTHWQTLDILYANTQERLPE